MNKNVTNLHINAREGKLSLPRILTTKIESSIFEFVFIIIFIIISLIIDLCILVELCRLLDLLLLPQPPNPFV